MDNHKSFLEKITDSVRDISNIAADAANYALQAEEPPLKPDRSAAAEMPRATQAKAGKTTRKGMRRKS